MFRLYAFNNADIMINMAAWPLDYIEEYKILCQARAIENQTYFICSSLTGKINENFNFGGNSMVIDFHGKIINKLDREEKVLTSFIDLGTMKEYKEQMPILKDTKNKYIQQAVNVFIASREPYSVKIFTNNDRLVTYYDLNGNLIESPHDFMRRAVDMFAEFENGTP